MIIRFQKYFVWCSLLLIALSFCRCGSSSSAPAINTKPDDSLQIQTLLKKGDSLYAQRSNMGVIAESMTYFDSAYRLAQRLNDTLLLANTLYYIGNVYNAWNGEPQTTIDYYSQSLALYNTLPAQIAKAFYVRYILAHAYDGEKAADSISCLQMLQEALADLQALPDSIRRRMNFISDFAWVATNTKAYSVAEVFLKLTPRYLIQNDPQTNNYLHHYWLTRARIDVYRKGYKQTPYFDSLQIALQACGNRFDSGYIASNLSYLYQQAGNAEEGLRFSRINEAINQRMGQGDILSVLRQKLLNREVQSEKEKQRRISSELRAKNWILGASVVLLLLTALLYFSYRKRRLEREEQRRQEEFTRLLLQKEEDERRRIATDLHDGVNHELLTLKNNLLLRKSVRPDDVEGVIISVREVSRNLYPALFESVGLEASIKASCERFTAAGFFTTCDIDYSPWLTKDEELQVYRIVQEALNNVAKHAGADAAKVTITSSGHSFMLEIKDNGKGFDAQKVAAANSAFGLQSISQRAKVIGAHLSIVSTRQGTTILLNKQR